MRRPLILLAAAGLLAAGCGGGHASSKPTGPPLTKAQYQAKLQQIAKDVGKSLGSSTSSSQKLSKADVDKVVSAVKAFTSRLEQVNPPAEIKALHTRLITAMNDFADEFPGIADQLNKAQSSKDAGAAIAALFGSKAFRELGTLQTDFKAKGYDLNLNG